MPSRNEDRACSRSACTRVPWMEATGKFSCRRRLARRSTPRFVSTKTRTKLSGSVRTANGGGELALLNPPVSGWSYSYVNTRAALHITGSKRHPSVEFVYDHMDDYGQDWNSSNFKIHWQPLYTFLKIYSHPRGFRVNNNNRYRPIRLKRNMHIKRRMLKSSLFDCAARTYTWISISTSVYLMSLKGACTLHLYYLSNWNLFDESLQKCTTNSSRVFPWQARKNRCFLSW